MADRGVDVISDGDIIYQVKWSSKLEQDSVGWLKSTIDDERDNIARLVSEGASEYILMTSVAGTTTSTNTGTVQRLEVELAKYSKEFGIPIDCWWQADMDAEVDAAPDAIKWSYEEMLAGADTIRFLMQAARVEGQAAEMRTTLLNVMARQWREDSRIKFSQLDLDRVDLTTLFVDVEASLVARPSNVTEGFSSQQNYEVHGSEGAAQYLLKTTAPLTYLLGVPGQGKSTLAQYVCQAHRAAILPGDMYGEIANYPIEAREPRLPLRVDLKDFATWLGGRNPFDEDDEAKRAKVRRSDRTLAKFLTALCSAKSDGRAVTVEHVHSLLERYPCLLLFDGLDEIGDAALRRIAVDEINSLAMQMGGQNRHRTFQFVVTARPNASGLPAPDTSIFQTLELKAMQPTLQREFVEKWANLHNVTGGDRSRLRRTFRNRTASDHVAQLADNPMQLTILLFLMHRHGEAVPVGRTELYKHYVDMLLSREVNKDQIPAGQAELVKQATAFLGWHIQSGVEVNPNAERLSRKAIETALILYLRDIDGPWESVPDLVGAATDRLWALSSKVEGTFEFAVQPLKEYCAALFLASWAGLTLREPIPQSKMLAELIERPYWLNTARYYAGFASPNECAGLRYGLQEALAHGAYPLQQRTATWALLNDGIFAAVAPVQRDVTSLLTDPLSIRLIADSYGNLTHFAPLSKGNGGSQLSAHIRADLENDPSSSLTRPRAVVLRHHLQTDAPGLAQWWHENLQPAIESGRQDAWLKIGGCLEVPRLMPPVADKLDVSSPESSRLALSCGATPTVGSRQSVDLLRNVLDGHCSDVRTSSTSEAGVLLKSVRPQWALQLPDNNYHGPGVPNEHFWMKTKDRSSRSSSLGLLVRLDAQNERIKRAANARARGQKGTTEPWQNLAREVARVYGPCWLAADIAITGAACLNVSPQGSFDPGGDLLGPGIDYGSFTMAVRRGPDASWWAQMHDQYDDELSRRTWSLALLAAAPAEFVLGSLENIDAALMRMDADTYAATAASSSRLGLTNLPRRLPPDCLYAAADLSSRTLLVLSHFACRLDDVDSMPAISDDVLLRMAELAAGSASCWAVARALTARMIIDPGEGLLGGLKLVGPESWVNVSPNGVNLSPEMASDMLNDPALYPASWLQAAEYLHSQANKQLPLRDALTAKGWLT